jgi:hypothetical protein
LRKKEEGRATHGFVEELGVGRRSGRGLRIQSGRRLFA